MDKQVPAEWFELTPNGIGPLEVGRRRGGGITPCSVSPEFLRQMHDHWFRAA